MNSIYKDVRSISAVFLDGHKNITVMDRIQTKKVIIEHGRAVVSNRC